MDILGFNIERGKRAFIEAEPEAPKEETKKPAKPSGEPLGDSGTSIYNGIVSEEYNSTLANEAGIRVYDEMRRSDGTVRAVLLAATLPIRRASWFVEPVSEEQKDKDVAEFVNKALFDWMDMTWDDFLRQALLMVPFGVMPFEKVFDFHTDGGKTYVIWRELAPRMPKTILSWELKNGERGIQQQRRDGKIAEMPLEKLLVFVNEREGDNWWGMSFLRAAYKHWYMKNNFYKIDAIAFERQGLGVPFCKMPDGYSDADEAKAMRANEKAYVVIPKDYEIGFLDMGAKSVRDPNPSIAHHNREITKAILAQFLELGATETGSRALSEDHSDLFFKSLESIANNIADVFNKYAIPQLVDLNFSDVEAYPTLDYGDISRIDVQALATAYGALITSGGIKRTDADEMHFRAMLGLPEVTEEDLAQREEEEAALAKQMEDQEVDARLGVTDEKKRAK